ncbi:trypsin-like peptidase domain-containing protein [Paraflavitalea pollutisoli]|uniref:trypsin-like peptidase domain-containing protein n=1 Tax=Paraflavitalea pollutisoli TaxID=3034143 RepID=UPI0023EB8321|nr:trypsin-like peptidase domain-containing protein [Paraflavitalea sp. H1-2-19X]
MLLNRLFVSILLLSAITVYGRQQPIPVPAALRTAIERARPASVRCYGFDTVQQQQNSAPFSAVVVTADGYLLTVAHTTRPQQTYKVHFPDGREALAVGLGRIARDNVSNLPDVAMMKLLAPGPWPFAPMGHTAAMRSGDPCLMIAYPETLAQPFPTVRFGVVANPRMESEFLATTAVMEPGDSGGPLFDLQGRVIALNSRCDTSEDRNFHTPVDLYRQYWTALTKAETYTDFPAADKVKVPTAAAVKYAPVPAQVKLANAAVVSLQSEVAGKLQSIAGTAISLDGRGTYILSKSSEVGAAPVVVTNQERLLAKVVSHSREHDLVLLWVDKKLTGALSKTDTSYAGVGPAPGSFVYAALPGGRQKRGVVGCAPIALPVKYSSGFFGAGARWMDGAATLANIHPNSPLVQARIQLQDKILRFGGQPIHQPADYGALLAQYFPNDTLVLDVKRGDSLFQQTIVMGAWPARTPTHPAELFKGGASVRRDGFASVWTIDARVQAAECGAPVYDAAGKCCGIVISRFSRTAALVMPMAVINGWMAPLLRKE